MRRPIITCFRLRLVFTWARVIFFTPIVISTCHYGHMVWFWRCKHIWAYSCTGPYLRIWVTSANCTRVQVSEWAVEVNEWPSKASESICQYLISTSFGMLWTGGVVASVDIELPSWRGGYERVAWYLRPEYRLSSNPSCITWSISTLVHRSSTLVLIPSPRLPSPYHRLSKMSLQRQNTKINLYNFSKAKEVTISSGGANANIIQTHILKASLFY